MVKINKETIIAFAKDINNSAYEDAYSKTHYILEIIMKDIMEVNPYISNYSLYVANEVFTGAETPASTLDLFLSIDAKQLELNFNEDKFYKLKNNIKNFGKNFIQNFKLFSKKKSNKQIEKNESSNTEIPKYQIETKKLNNYNIKDFYIDIMHELAKYFTSKTQLSLMSNCIQVSSKEDLGVLFRLFVVFDNYNNTFSLYNLNSKTKTVIDFRNRYENLEIINLKTNNNFIKQVKIFNNLFLYAFKHIPNQILIESLLYSCPVELFNDDVYETTFCLINYLKNISLSRMVSICDNNELLKENLIYKNSAEILYKFIKMIKIEN